MMTETDADLLLLAKLRKTKSWRDNAQFERFGKPGDLLNNVKSALRYLGYNEILSAEEFNRTAGRLFNLIQAERRKQGGRTNSKRTKARKRQSAEPTLF